MVMIIPIAFVVSATLGGLRIDLFTQNMPLLQSTSGHTLVDEIFFALRMLADR